MKDFKKKFDRFMLKSGGYALLVATVATVGFFAVLQWSNDYVKEKTGELEISVDKDGYLSVDYNYDDKENVYILWETDGGTIKSDHKSEVFLEQESDDKNKGYYSYSLSNEKAYWTPMDADGNTYDTATVRAVLYERDTDDIYKLENYVTEVTITLSYADGKVTETEERLFSNPIRDGGDKNWSQIYCIEESDNGYTYRYRTGEEINKDEVLILCWESKEENISETDYAKGLYPTCTTVEDNSDKKLLKAVTTMGCSKDKITDMTQIEAYLINESTYKNDKIEERNKINVAKLEIN